LRDVPGLEETDKRVPELAGPLHAHDNGRVHESVTHPYRSALSASRARTAYPVAELSVTELERDMPGVSIPRPEIHLVIRYDPFGSSTRRGFDVHALGARHTVRRKFLQRGQRAVMARLQLGTHEVVFGASASAIAGRIVPLEDLWGVAASQQLFEQLASTHSPLDAAAVLERALCQRVTLARKRSAHAHVALQAIDRLGRASVSSVAHDLGMSERHLRRVFREVIGVGPKTFTRLARFRRALHAAHKAEHPSWASIASAVGYYDQAHLIAEFRGIAGVAPQALLSELRASLSIG
jgi:AraC-like DNA-binding protein